jgi:hypothetical protein
MSNERVVLRIKKPTGVSLCNIKNAQRPSSAIGGVVVESPRISEPGIYAGTSRNRIFSEASSEIAVGINNRTRFKVRKVKHD